MPTRRMRLRRPTERLALDPRRGSKKRPTSLRRSLRTTRPPQLPSRPSSSESERLLSVVRKLTRLLWLPGPRTTCDPLFAVFWDTSIPERRSFWTRFDRPTSKRAKPVVSRSRSVPHTSLSKPSDKRQPLSTRMASSSSRFPVSLSSTHPVTSPSLTSDPVVPRSATSPSWSSTSCTASSPRPSSLCAC